MSSRPHRSRAELRALMSRPVVSVSVAAEWLPGDDAKNREWLRVEGLVHVWGDREVVVWTEVEERIRALPTTADPSPAVEAPARSKKRGAAPSNLPRVAL